MRRRDLALVLASALAAGPAQASEEDQAPGLVVLDIQAGKAVPKEVASVLSDILLVHLRGTDAFGVINSMADLKDVMALEQEKAALGCVEDGCLAELGGMLGVPYMLRSQVGKVGKVFVVTLNLIGVDAATVVARAMVQAKGEDALPQAVSEVVPRLIASYNAQGGSSQTDVVPALGEPRHVVINRWIRRGGYAMGGLSVGLAGLGLINSNEAQSMVNPGPQQITERELGKAQTTLGQANLYAGGAIAALASGVGLVVWSLVR